MDRLSLVPRKLAHSFGGSARRSGKQDFEIFSLKVFYNALDRRRFTCSGASREDENSVLYGFFDSVGLGFCIFYS